VLINVMLIKTQCTYPWTDRCQDDEYFSACVCSKITYLYFTTL